MKMKFPSLPGLSVSHTAIEVKKWGMGQIR